jgi:hypothetical protein
VEWKDGPIRRREDSDDGEEYFEAEGEEMVCPVDEDSADSEEELLKRMSAISLRGGGIGEMEGIDEMEGVEMGGVEMGGVDEMEGVEMTETIDLTKIEDNEWSSVSGVEWRGGPVRRRAWTLKNEDKDEDEFFEATGSGTVDSEEDLLRGMENITLRDSRKEPEMTEMMEMTTLKKMD